MRETIIDLSLKFKIPEKDITFNGLLWGLRKKLSEIMGVISKTLVKGIGDDKNARNKT
jgi:hypothetical protein